MAVVADLPRVAAADRRKVVAVDATKRLADYGEFRRKLPFGEIDAEA